MRTPIFKNEEDALTDAKNQACYNWEEKDPKDFLIRDTSCNCECGETAAIRVVYFDQNNEQHFGLSGICNCGQ